MLEGDYVGKRELILVTPGEQAIWSLHGGRTGDTHSLFLNHNVIALSWGIK